MRRRISLHGRTRDIDFTRFVFGTRWPHPSIPVDLVVKWMAGIVQRIRAGISFGHSLLSPIAPVVPVKTRILQSGDGEQIPQVIDFLHKRKNLSKRSDRGF